MFIVIEGIDGAGCETQAVNLQKWLKKNNLPFSFIKYPNYEANVGKFIREFLYNNKNLSAEMQFLLYSLQFLSDREFIRHERKNKVVIADRYFSSTLCFQALEGVTLEKQLRFAKDFRIEVPDMVFYLNVNPNIAIKRKFGEQKEKNRREKDFDFIRKTYVQYQKLVKDQVWTKWVNIDGEKDIDEVTKSIFNHIKNRL
ncbi:dTMP kinase [Candidatus Roizmanbacteria bacterium CG2_30_33_16]|uniref:Thymidylate kinase n=5 Tax=Candidatus Roizmaniibacteriota TaxID=1752723 RepID=A0A2M7E5J3_9BACT|nr:dTMP kinase [Candidatus Roizmanbacteria bacterium]OIP84164.1 MAG: dTMP kinase [Candidatus Roizmanbacteria bacterium CG2_30_33_16]PIP64199.1 MAG: dTMP kinase [Candidatus Roizmanbacteria bacterium CG22_combo_CG10-13_8_21_14_all_33_16]PIV63000.1 MAG: dTMP kinase [Candidatus Roizmanbacteria bacterium CG01_land_8_20_14_3_00_33_9]PIX74183.1 MAG: dTMP kinase [Candidatus Roizmanbacteria bacterium CG_4_10_14_3_um_filter_33_21]PJB87846.1 MAG: dTMP kinase [Candidatus Roizmanbacteria bacterium CG_4_9_1